MRGFGFKSPLAQTTHTTASRAVQSNMVYLPRLTSPPQACAAARRINADCFGLHEVRLREHPYVLDINSLWHSSDADAWEHARQRYWDFVQPKNLELERTFDALDRSRLERFTAQEWYKFLRDEYFRWKYTAPNRYATTTLYLQKYEDTGAMAELDVLRRQILNLDVTDVQAGLKVAKKIRGLGTAGASGLLSLIYPEHFATVDQFVVKALRGVRGLPESDALASMKPQNLRVTDGVLLISILGKKAHDNNRLFGTQFWTPRKLDMVLWTYGR